MLHFKYAYFVRGAKAVFDRTKEPQRIMPVALEIQNGIHHMFKHTRPCYGTLFCDMTDYENCAGILLCNSGQYGCSSSDLSDASGSVGYLGAHHCLNRINDQKPWLKPLNFAFDGFDIGLCKYKELIVYAAAARAYLKLRS